MDRVKPATSESLTLSCSRCGEQSSVQVPAGISLANDAAFVCRKCAGYVEPSKTKRRRVPPPTRERREIPWEDLGLRSPDGHKLSGEDAVNAIAYQHEEPHVTSPWARAFTKTERQIGIYRQEALAVVVPEDLAGFEAVLKDMLDADERWVMNMRAMGESRDAFLATLSEADRLRFQAAWRRLTRKMDKVKASLKKRAARRYTGPDGE